MTSHDQTSVNQQGGDVGSQYRSAIYLYDDEQKEIAGEVVKQLAAHFERPIVTEISAAEVFHKAVEYHQDYYNQNSGEGYCNVVITPKLAKLRNLHANNLKTVDAL